MLSLSPPLSRSLSVLLPSVPDYRAEKSAVFARYYGEQHQTSPKQGKTLTIVFSPCSSVRSNLVVPFPLRASLVQINAHPTMLTQQINTTFNPTVLKNQQISAVVTSLKLGACRERREREREREERGVLDGCCTYWSYLSRWASPRCCKE